MVRKKVAILLISPLALLAVSAHADDCSKASTQTAMNACAAQSAKAADIQLNQLYGQIQARLKDSPTGRTHLVAAQRAWIAFRDAECSFAASAVEGGSIMPMIHSNCMENVTRKRIADFKQYLSCPEGDVSCPVPAN